MLLQTATAPRLPLLRQVLVLDEADLLLRTVTAYLQLFDWLLDASYFD